MTIADIVGREQRAAPKNPKVFYLNGAIGRDDEDGLFRLYPDPLSPRSYYVIEADAVVGDVYEWTLEELARQGVVGARMYRVGLLADTMIRSVEITLERVGDSIAGQTAEMLRAPLGGGGCRYSRGCRSTKCCTERSRGCGCNHCCVARSPEVEGA